MQIEIKFNAANFQQLPPSKKSENPKPYGIIEFMGGSELVSNDPLFPSVEGVTVVCEGRMMRGQLQARAVIDILKDGKSLTKTANLRAS